MLSEGLLGVGWLVRHSDTDSLSLFFITATLVCQLFCTTFLSVCRLPVVASFVSVFVSSFFLKHEKSQTDTSMQFFEIVFSMNRDPY